MIDREQLAQAMYCVYRDSRGREPITRQQAKDEWLAIADAVVARVQPEIEGQRQLYMEEVDQSNRLMAERDRLREEVAKT